MRKRSDGELTYVTCVVCCGRFAFGPHQYDGRWVRDWKSGVCRTCLKGNWDGVVPSDALFRRLEEAGATIAELNDQGWLDIPA